MSVVIQDTIVAPLKVIESARQRCVNEMSNEQFLYALPQLLVSQYPVSVSGVIVGVEQPSTADRDKLWIRRDVRGNIVGQYLFQISGWKPFYNLAPGETVELRGDSNYPPDGFTPIIPGYAGIPEDQVNYYVSKSLPLSLGSGFQVYFAVFSGYD